MSNIIQFKKREPTWEEETLKRCDAIFEARQEKLKDALYRYPIQHFMTSPSTPNSQPPKTEDDIMDINGVVDVFAAAGAVQSDVSVYLDEIARSAVHRSHDDEDREITTAILDGIEKLKIVARCALVDNYEGMEGTYIPVLSIEVHLGTQAPYAPGEDIETLCGYPGAASGTDILTGELVDDEYRPIIVYQFRPEIPHDSLLRTQVPGTAHLIGGHMAIVPETPIPKFSIGALSPAPLTDVLSGPKHASYLWARLMMHCSPSLLVSSEMETSKRPIWSMFSNKDGWSFQWARTQGLTSSSGGTNVTGIHGGGMIIADTIIPGVIQNWP